MMGLTADLLRRHVLLGSTFCLALSGCAPIFQIFRLYRLPTLPPHWMYLPDQGEDMNAGRLVSIDSNLVIHYHAGSLPRDYANTKASGAGLQSARLGKSSFQYLHSNNILFVTFRNEGPANYWVEVKSQEDFDFIVELLARYRKE